MIGLLKWGGQAVVYVGMALWLGYFANMPVYTHHDPGLALIKLSVLAPVMRETPCQ